MRIEDVVIGASESAKPLGMSRWETPLKFYARKIGLETDDDETEAARLGRFLEPSIAAVLGDELEVPLHKGETVYHPDYPWLRASPDYFFKAEEAPRHLRESLQLEDGERVLVEVKTTGLASFLHRGRLDDDWGEAGGDHIPLDYVAQVQTQIGVADAAWRFFDDGFCNRAFVKALLPGRGAPSFRVLGERNTFGFIRRQLQDFVDDHLVPEIPPPPSDSEDHSHSQQMEDWGLLEEMCARRRTSKSRRPTAGPEEDAAVLDWRAKKIAAEKAAERAAEARVILVSMMNFDYGWEGPWGHLLHTLGTEHRKVAKTSVYDEFALAIANDTSPTAKMFRDIVARNTNDVFTGRSLRPTWADEPKKPKTQKKT